MWFVEAAQTSVFHCLLWSMLSAVDCGLFIVVHSISSDCFAESFNSAAKCIKGCACLNNNNNSDIKNNNINNNNNNNKIKK